MNVKNVLTLCGAGGCSGYTEKQVRAWAKHLGVSIGDMYDGVAAIELFSVSDAMEWVDHDERGHTGVLKLGDAQVAHFVRREDEAGNRDGTYIVLPIFSRMPELRAILNE